MSLYFVVSRRAEKTFQIDAINLHFSMVWLMGVLIVLIKLSSQFVFGIFTDNVQNIYLVTEDFCGFVALKRTDAETTMSAGRFNFDFIMVFVLLEPLINHVVFPRIVMKFLITGTFRQILTIT
jgi:hypothetical protein